MPNWCENELEIYGDRKTIKKIKQEVFTKAEDIGADQEEYSYLDFDKVIPMPRELVYTQAPPNIVSEEVIRMRDLLKANPSLQSIWVQDTVAGFYRHLKLDQWSEKYISERQSEILKKTYGADNWYDWRLMNWGTKWGIDGESIHFYHEDDKSIQLNFSTAWSPPEQVARNLRWKYEKEDDFAMRWFYREDDMEFSGYL